MSNKNKEIIHKDNVLQAVIISDTFEDEFTPISKDTPSALLPLLNKPLLDYTLEFLAFGGVGETFLFCCSHVDLIRDHIRKSRENSVGWTLNMNVHILASESCRSFGDCLRDLDAKGLLRDDFVLLEPGVVSNIKLLPILKEHKEIAKKDKGAAITLIYQEVGGGQVARSKQDEFITVVDPKNRVLFYERLGRTKKKNINLPMEILLENDGSFILHNLKDTHLAICSSAVLPLFSDNFDFQTRDDFIRGLLMNEEIMGSTMYVHTLKGAQYAGAVTNWHNYQAISWEVNNRSAYPSVQPQENRCLENAIIGKNTVIPECASISDCILGDNVTIGTNVTLVDSLVMSNCKIGNNVTINLSVVGQNCQINDDCKITNAVLGNGVVVEKLKEIEDDLIQSTKPDFCEKDDVLGNKAYRIKLDDEDEDGNEKKPKRLFSLKNWSLENEESEDDDGFSDSDDEELSHTHSPPPDDTKLFFTEVIDSLTRGFEDQLQCDNLILEINSSRYAYNVTVKEVNFNVIKAILHMYLRQCSGPRFFSQLLTYFTPILKNYIRNKSAMVDCLQAIEDVAISNEEVEENWVLFVLKWFYSKDHLTEEAILKWGKNLDSTNKFAVKVKPFLDWLEEAEEASSSDED